MGLLTTSLALPSSLREERLILLASTEGIRLSREGEYERVLPGQASLYLEELGPSGFADIRGFVSRLRLSSPRPSLPSLDDRELLALLHLFLKTGVLIALRERRGGAGPVDASTAELRRLVRAIEAKTRRRLSYSGRQYRLVADEDLARLPDRDSYQVVQHDEAARVLDGLARQGGAGAADLAGLLGKAREKLTRDWRPPLRPDGLVLLRKVVIQAPIAPEGPAVTPSQMKKLLHQTEWIEIEVVDQDGEPYTGHYRLELPEADTTEGDFDENGFYGNYDIAPGECKLWLGRPVVTAGAEAPAEPTVAEAASGVAEPASGGDEPDSDVDEPATEQGSVGVELLDEEGNHVAEQPFKVRLPDGQTVEGTTLGSGPVMVEVPSSTGDVEIVFPNLMETDFNYQPPLPGARAAYGSGPAATASESASV